MKNKSNFQIGLNLKPKQYQRLLAVSQKFGLTPATFCRMALINFFISN